MRLSELTAVAVCAALLGVAASYALRGRLFEIVSMGDAVTPEVREPPQGEGLAGGVARRNLLCSKCPPAEMESDSEPAGEPEKTRPEPRPMLRSRRDAARTRRAHRSDRHAPSHEPGGEAFSQEIERGIRQVGEHGHEIKRETLELALANLMVLSGSVRVTPHVRAGKPVGFRLSGIRSDGPFARLGLRNEDVLVSVNGIEIATLEKVLEAYGKLRKARHLVLGLERGGATITEEYTIQ